MPRREREVPASIIRTARSGSDADASQAGSVLGTPGYMAPEQARGEIDELDERADVFGLGSILCEIITGEPAFLGRASRDASGPGTPLAQDMLSKATERRRVMQRHSNSCFVGHDDMTAGYHTCISHPPLPRHHLKVAALDTT